MSADFFTTFPEMLVQVFVFLTDFDNHDIF